MKSGATAAVALGVFVTAGGAIAQAPPPGPPPPGYGPPPPAYAAPEGEPEEREAKNAVYGELLGPGLLYSVNYDRFFTEELGGRIGFGYISVTARAGSGSNQVTEKSSVITVPITLSYLGIGSKKHIFEVGGGATILHVSGSVDTLAASADGEATTAYGTVLFGYRLQPPDGGFQFRVGGSPIIYSGIDEDSPTLDKKIEVLPWGYISFGGAF